VTLFVFVLALSFLCAVAKLAKISHRFEENVGSTPSRVRPKNDHLAATGMETQSFQPGSFYVPLPNSQKQQNNFERGLWDTLSQATSKNAKLARLDMGTQCFQLGHFYVSSPNSQKILICITGF
jgi:hypothetical protein